MKHVPHLPPVIRALCVLGLLFALAALGAWLWAFQSIQANQYLPVARWMPLATALMFISAACNATVLAYVAQVLYPEHAWPRLDSWHAQLTMALALAALPIALVAVTLLAGVTFAVTGAVWVLWGFSAFINIGAALWGLIRITPPMHTAE